MIDAAFADAALVLVGHGSTIHAGSSAPTHQHAEALRHRGIFAQVLECFWKEEPPICEILRGVSAPRVFIVPLCISEGYFTQELIPRELGLATPGQTNFHRVQQRGAQALFYCEPVGTHASISNLLLARAGEVVARHPFPHAPKPGDITLFLAGHGTTRNENSRKAVEHQVEQLRSRQRYAAVHPVFMEEDPRIGTCYQTAATDNIVIVPFFISDGLHSVEDIPVLLGEPAALVRQRLQQGLPTWRNPTGKHGKRVWYSDSLGSDPSLTDVILERVVGMASQ